MKKIITFFIVLVVIIAGMFYMYSNYKANIRQAKRENTWFERYTDTEIEGLELATIINKVVDSNEKNGVQKDNKGKYVDNGQNSINIDIKFLDNDSKYNIEKIYKSGIDKFISYYRLIKFKCTNIEYHYLTKKIKYLEFEQITQ